MASKHKIQFKSKHRMLLDFGNTIMDSESTIAASVAKRHFDKYYTLFIDAYEALVGIEECSSEEISEYNAQFSEVNQLLIRLEQKLCHEVSSPGKETITGVSKESQVRARLPFIEIPKFSGNMIEWVPFFDLFQSLVHERPNMSDAEKHYYLRASLEGEALSIIRQLPMDESNYEVALTLLKARYQNHRLLLDTYLDRIINLPVIQPNHSLRSDFFDPLRESIQALEGLKVPIKEWSYFILYLTLQKLPVRIRSLFEERYGKSRDDLPTLEQLIELLDEQCRLFQAVSEPSWVRTPRPSTSHRGRALPGRGTPATSQPKGVSSSAPRKVESSRHSYQVTSITCSYCDQSDHTLYKCDSFRHLAPSQRKSWARKSGHCFKCLRKHYAKECQHPNWCYHCGSKEHNSLICLEPKGSGKERADTQVVAASEPSLVTTGGRSSPPRTVNTSSNDYQHTTYQPLRPRVGERAAQAQAQFNELRYGLRMSQDLE